MSAAAAYLSVPVVTAPQQFAPSFLHVREHLASQASARGGGPGGAGEAEEDPEKPFDRTLFAAGVPVGVEEMELHRAFSELAEVDAVLLSKVGGTRVAHVVFDTAQGRKKALSLLKKGIKEPLQCFSVEDARPQGLKKWIAEHRAQRPGNDALQSRADAWIRGWEAEQKRAEEEAEAAAQVEEGWTLVTSKKGKNKNISASGVVIAGVNKNKAVSLGAQKAITKNKGQVEDFYRFQKREKNRDAMLLLREQFEEDKRKVAKLKAARKFRPY